MKDLNLPIDLNLPTERKIGSCLRGQSGLAARRHITESFQHPLENAKEYLVDCFSSKPAARRVAALDYTSMTPPSLEYMVGGLEPTLSPRVARSPASNPPRRRPAAGRPDGRAKRTA